MGKMLSGRQMARSMKKKLKKRNPSCWDSQGFVPACAGIGKRGKSKKKGGKKKK